jgi:large subunit ribosomal protein L13
VDKHDPAGGDCLIGEDKTHILEGYYFRAICGIKKGMKTDSFRTVSQRKEDVDRKWFVIDASGLVVGRLASKVASVLRGKHKPTYTPHVDGGDFVIVVNAEKVRFTGNKEQDKEYFRHTGYPGGAKTETVAKVRARKPEFIIQNATKGMLPHTKQGRAMLRRLKVYAGPDHPHEAQSPETMELN